MAIGDLAPFPPCDLSLSDPQARSGKFLEMGLNVPDDHVILDGQVPRPSFQSLSSARRLSIYLGENAKLPAAIMSGVTATYGIPVSRAASTSTRELVFQNWLRASVRRTC